MMLMNDVLNTERKEEKKINCGWSGKRRSLGLTENENSGDQRFSVSPRNTIEKKIFSFSFSSLSGLSPCVSQTSPFPW